LNELPPRPPPWSLFRKRCSIPRASFIQLSVSPVDEPSSRFPKQEPYGKKCPSPEHLLHILQGAQQGSPLSRFPSQSPHRERHSTSRAPFNRMSPLQVAQLSPHEERCPPPQPFVKSGPLAK
jgi:hypothetical protein